MCDWKITIKNKMSLNGQAPPQRKCQNKWFRKTFMRCTKYLLYLTTMTPVGVLSLPQHPLEISIKICLQFTKKVTFFSSKQDLVLYFTKSLFRLFVIVTKTKLTWDLNKYVYNNVTNGMIYISYITSHCLYLSTKWQLSWCLDVFS